MNTTEIKPAIAAAIFNDDGEILLQKRRHSNEWCIISGHVEFGETIQDAVLREIEEETNVKAAIVRLIGIYSSPTSQTYCYKNKNIQYVTSYFEARLLEELDFTFSNEETEELRFFNPCSLPFTLAQMDHHWLSDALAKSTETFIR